MNLFAEFTARVNLAVERIGAERFGVAKPDLSAVKVEPPRDASHGDLSSNAAMVLAKAWGAQPRALAEAVAEAMRADADIETVEVAGPGFVNMRLTGDFWRGFLRSVLAEGAAYGRASVGGGAAVNVEYVSANPTGPMHVGHCRGAVVGDALANLLAFAGWDVTREYYINDAGAQVDILGRSAYLRYREALGETIAIPEGLYPGDYLKPVGAALAAEHGNALLHLDEADWLPITRDAAIDTMMALIRDDLAALNVKHDVFFSERTLTLNGRDLVDEAIEVLAGRDLIYEGVLPPPKGQLPDDWEDREQTLFRSTAYGDDIDRPLKKSDGSYTYFAGDIAYHFDKYRRGFRTMIDVWGADHGGYVKRMQAAVAALSNGEAALDVKLCQLVKLYRAGEPVRMSKRSGDFVTLRDVVDEVGVDAVRFMMLYRKNDAPLDFDFQKVTEQSKDNPVFYVQYAHARCASIFRQAKQEVPKLSSDIDALLAADLSGLSDPGELMLVKRIAEYPRLIESAAQAHEPHRLAFYLNDLASEFHAHWNRGKELPQLRFINANETNLTLARLALVHAAKMVFASGLLILGVNAPEEMR